MRKLLLPVLCAALAGCATLGTGRFERSAERVAGLLNSGQAGELAAMSRTPFLLDGEPILLDADVAALWSGMVAAGFRIDQAAVATAVPLDPDSYKRFAPTMEVRAFFGSYVSERGSIVALDAGRSRILLLLDRGKMGRTVIVGFKGPDFL